MSLHDFCDEEFRDVVGSFAREKLADECGIDEERISISLVTMDPFTLEIEAEVDAPLDAEYQGEYWVR